MTNAEVFSRAQAKVRRMQEALGGLDVDGFPGPLTLARFWEAQRSAKADPDGIWNSVPEDLWHHTLASSFADLEDVRRFNDCKAEGHSDKYCFAYGDNGIGCWEDVTAQASVPMVALPPDDMIEHWDSVAGAKHKSVIVRANGREVHAVLADRMPARKFITNGAGIDLNPATLKLLGLQPPILVAAQWRWG